MTDKPNLRVIQGGGEGDDDFDPKVGLNRSHPDYKWKREYYEYYGNLTVEDLIAVRERVQRENDAGMKIALGVVLSFFTGPLAIFFLLWGYLDKLRYKV